MFSCSIDAVCINSMVTSFSMIFICLYLDSYSSELDYSEEEEDEEERLDFMLDFVDFLRSLFRIFIFFYKIPLILALSLSLSSEILCSSRHSQQYQASLGTEDKGGDKQIKWKPQLHLSHNKRDSSSVGVFVWHILQTIFSRCSSHSS